MWHTRCNSKTRLDGKTAVITGANTGIGKETARDLYRRGARVIMACRNMDKAKNAMKDIKNNPFFGISDKKSAVKLSELAIYQLDLNSLQSVKECSKNLLAKEANIHILVNNAGVMMCPYEKTKDGYEVQFQTNYLGLTSSLFADAFTITKNRIFRSWLQNSERFIMFRFGTINFNDINLENSTRLFTPLKAYTQSKLANILFSKELARRLKEAGINGINTYSLHPGVILTELNRYYDKTIIPGATFFYKYIIMRTFIKTAVQGAQTTIYCSVDDQTANETGLLL